MPTPPILIAEDDHDTRLALRAYLEEVGYEVLSASNGREALMRLQEAPLRPELMLIDLMMPVMDGWQLIDQLRSSSALASIPYAVLSGYTATDAPAGALAVISKPIDQERLLDLVSSYCSPALRAVVEPARACRPTTSTKRGTSNGLVR